jgi:glycosyltransferase involved in cell wall biosynthesis
VLAVANLYRAAHVERLAPYRPLNPAASSWNTALFDELARLGLDLHVAQFLPIRRAQRIDDGGITYHYLPRLPQLDNVTSAFKRWRVGRLVDALSPDVVHGIGSEHGYAWPAVGQGVPSVVTIHGYLRVINKLAGHRNLARELLLVREEHRALVGADRLISINEFMRERFVADGADTARTRIVPNALNPVFLEPFDEPATRSIDLLMVGTLHRLKNQHVALEILARLRDEHGLQPRTVIVGAATVESADYAAQLQRAHGELRLHNVTFAGKKSPAELAAMYRNCRFLLHISEFEADPTVVAEALACGAVPVANPVAGLAYRVKDGENGHHLPVADRAGAPARLARILRDDALRATLARNGRDRVLAERRPRAVAAATVEVYRELQAGGSRPD